MLARPHRRPAPGSRRRCCSHRIGVAVELDAACLRLDSLLRQLTCPFRCQARRRLDCRSGGSSPASSSRACSTSLGAPASTGALKIVDPRPTPTAMAASASDCTARRSAVSLATVSRVCRSQCVVLSPNPAAAATCFVHGASPDPREPQSLPVRVVAALVDLIERLVLEIADTSGGAVAALALIQPGQVVLLPTTIGRVRVDACSVPPSGAATGNTTWKMVQPSLRR